MKSKTLIVVFLFSYFFSFAQSDSTKLKAIHYKNQIGFGVSDLLFNNLKYSNKKIENYKVFYRRLFKNINLNIGFNYKYLNQIFNANTFFTIFNISNTFNKDYIFYIGVDKYVYSNKSIKLLVGLDYSYKKSNHISYNRDSSFLWVSTFNTYSNSYGLLGFFRAEYFFTRRFSISTDVIITGYLEYYNYSSSYPNKPPDYSSSKLYNLDFNFPKTIYLNYSF